MNQSHQVACSILLNLRHDSVLLSQFSRHSGVKCESCRFSRIAFWISSFASTRYTFTMSRCLCCSSGRVQFQFFMTDFSFPLPLSRDWDPSQREVAPLTKQMKCIVVQVAQHRCFPSVKRATHLDANGVAFAFCNDIHFSQQFIQLCLGHYIIVKHTLFLS